MFLPCGRFHDCGDRRAFGTSQQGEDCLLLGLATSRTRAKLPALCSPVRLLGRRDFSGNVAVRHNAILSVATANAPSPPKPHSGGIASGAGSEAKGPASNVDSTDALFAVEVQAFTATKMRAGRHGNSELIARKARSRAFAPPRRQARPRAAIGAAR